MKLEPCSKHSYPVSDVLLEHSCTQAIEAFVVLAFLIRQDMRLIPFLVVSVVSVFAAYELFERFGFRRSAVGMNSLNFFSQAGLQIVRKTFLSKTLAYRLPIVSTNRRLSTDGYGEG